MDFKKNPGSIGTKDLLVGHFDIFQTSLNPPFRGDSLCSRAGRFRPFFSPFTALRAVDKRGPR